MFSCDIAQYLAVCSGVGVSVLLRQAQSFESLLAHCEYLAPDSLAIADRPKMPNSYLDYRPAVLGSRAYSHEYHDPIIAFEERFRLNANFLEGLPLFLEEADELLTAPVCPSKRVPLCRFPFEIRMETPKRGIPVSSADGLVPGANRLNVCLRHRLRSISKAHGWGQEAA
jgi:hypothetical protein